MYMSNDKFEELKKDFLYQLVNQPPQLNSITVITIVPDDRENDFIDYAKRVADRLNTAVSFVPKRYQSGECVIEAEFNWQKEDKFDRELKKQEELSLINNIVEQAIYHGGDIGGPYFSNGDGLCEAMEKYLVYKGFDKDTEVFYRTKGKDHNFVEFIKKENDKWDENSMGTAVLSHNYWFRVEEAVVEAVRLCDKYNNEREVFFDLYEDAEIPKLKEFVESKIKEADREITYDLEIINDKMSMNGGDWGTIYLHPHLKSRKKREK